MKIRKKFRTSSATIDYIISDFNLNRIANKDIYFRYCVNQRSIKLSKNYDDKLDNILNFIIKYSDYENLPILSLSRIILSLSKVTNALTKGFITLISNK